jgi:hypothetical protein
MSDALRELEDACGEQASVLVERCRRVFAGQPAPIIGAALADLLSIWLTAHSGRTPQETVTLRADILRMHLETVERLNVPNEKLLLERLQKRHGPPH